MASAPSDRAGSPPSRRAPSSFVSALNMAEEPDTPPAGSTSPPPSPTTASEFAHGWVARETAAVSGEPARLAKVMRVCEDVQTGLSRWFGPFGSLALLNRALSRAQTEHASLLGVQFSIADPPRLGAAPDRLTAHDDAATTAGIAAMLVSLSDLIARLIGDDLAINLLTQSLKTTPARAAEGDTGAPHDKHQPEGPNV